VWGEYQRATGESANSGEAARKLLSGRGIGEDRGGEMRY